MVEALGNLTIPEAIALTKELREKWGISDKVHPMMTPANNLVKEIEKVIEFYDVVLKNCGPQKIAVIKLIREVTKCGLADGKKMAETPDSVVVKSAPAEEAKKLAENLKQIGATAELVESQ